VAAAGTEPETGQSRRPCPHLPISIELHIALQIAALAHQLTGALQHKLASCRGANLSRTALEELHRKFFLCCLHAARQCGLAQMQLLGCTSVIGLVGQHDQMLQSAYVHGDEFNALKFLRLCIGRMHGAAQNVTAASVELKPFGSDVDPSSADRYNKRRHIWNFGSLPKPVLPHCLPLACWLAAQHLLPFRKTQVRCRQARSAVPRARCWPLLLKACRLTMLRIAKMRSEA
jgi:hypothetical protein